MESKALALGKMESKALALGKMESKALALVREVKAEALNSNVHLLSITLISRNIL